MLALGIQRVAFFVGTLHEKVLPPPLLPTSMSGFPVPLRAAPYGPGPNQFPDCGLFGCANIAWVSFNLQTTNGSFNPPNATSSAYTNYGYFGAVGEFVWELSVRCRSNCASLLMTPECSYLLVYDPGCLCFRLQASTSETERSSSWEMARTMLR
jgi:hypothetical protein